jgi:hypothetical protein
MISALFCVMVVVVGSSAVGREVHDELDHIRRGEKPTDDEVRRRGTRSPPRRGRAGTRCGYSSTVAPTHATRTERAHRTRRVTADASARI